MHWKKWILNYQSKPMASEVDDCLEPDRYRHQGRFSAHDFIVCAPNEVIAPYLLDDFEDTES